MRKKLTKLLFAFAFLFTSYTIQAQSIVYFSEDFSGSFPPTGWTIDGMDTQWSQKQTANAGGSPPEARLKWIDQNASTYFISPPVDLTGVTDVVFSFKHYLDDYSGTGYTIGVATRSGTNGTWNTVWSMNPSGSIDAQSLNIPISGGDVGASDFQIALFLTGNFYNFNYWYIDDVSLTKLSNLDLKMSSIELPDFTEQGNLDITAKMLNFGVTPITSFDVSYSVDGGAPVTESVTGINLPSTGEYSYTFSTPWNATSGNHSVEVSISNVNGGNDDDASDDILSKDVSVATNTTTNFPLFEEFTSSTCAPCANFNSSTMNPFVTAHENEIAVIKYQMNWPGSGDIYYTNEGGVRRVFYGVTGVPSLFAGGSEVSGSLSTAFNNEVARQTYFEITPTISISGNNVTVNADINSFVNANLKVYIAVVEKKTTGNVGSNGETEFHYVMMKMLPDANGTTVNFTANNTESLSYSHDMTDTHVEEMNDLLAVVFVQDDSSHIVYQSAKALLDPGAINNEILKGVEVYPNPSNGIFVLKGARDMNISIYNILGVNIMNKTAINDNETLNLADYPNGVYMLKLTQAEKTATIKLIINK